MFSQRSLFSAITVFFMFLSCSAYAENSYEISGLNLESSISDVEKKLGCKVAPHFRDEKSKSTPDSYGTFCRKEGGVQAVSFDKNKRIISLYASIDFDVDPGWDSIKEKLIKKYGKPDKMLEKKLTEKNEKITRTAICWGICKESESFYLEPEMNSLAINYDDANDIKTGKKKLSISMFMSHTDRLKKHEALRDKWLAMKKKE